MLAFLHHNRRIRRQRQTAFAITEHQDHAVAVVTVDSQIQMAIAIYIAESYVARTVGQWNGVGRMKDSATRGYQHGQSTRLPTGDYQIRLAVVIQIADDHVA